MTKSLLWAAAGTLVFCDKIIFVSLNYGFFLEKKRERGESPKSGYFIAIGSSTVKTVADRHSYTAYRNNHR